MLLIGILILILISSNNKLTIKEYKNIIYISILIMLYMIIILNNSTSIILISNGIMIYNNILLITTYNILIKNLIIILTIIYIIILYNYSYYYKNAIYIKEYIILILFNIFSICLFIDSINSLIIFIAIELQSYTIYLITSTYYKNELSIGIYSSKNGLIYFLLGSLASILILFGLTLIYNQSGLINLIDLNNYLTSLMDININNNNNIYSYQKYNYLIAFIFIFIGLFFKIGLAPLHNWLINIYSNIPTIITIWLSIIPKISILTFILTLNYIFFNIFNILNINILFQLFIILSMIFGALGGLPQFNIKRILAYSSLINSSYILFAIISYNQYSIFSFLFFIIQYSFTHFIIFMVIIFIIMYYNNWLIFKRFLFFNYNHINNYYNINNNNIIHNNNINYINNINSNNINNINNIDNKNNNMNNNNNIDNNNYYNFTHNIYINDIINLLNYNKSLTLIFIICLASLIGLPPLLGFYGKYYILITGLLNGYWFTSILLILVSVISAFYYGYIIKILLSNDYFNNIYSLFYNINNNNINNINNNNINNINNNNNINNINNNNNINNTNINVNNNNNNNNINDKNNMNNKMEGILNIYKLNNDNMRISYIYSYIMSLISIMILFPILYIDIYQNGIVIINYLNNM